MLRTVLFISLLGIAAACHAQSDTMLALSAPPAAGEALATTDMPPLQEETTGFQEAPLPAPEADAVPERRYHLRYQIDIPVTAAGAAWSLYAFPKIYDKPHSDLADIEALNKKDINGFDRWAAGMHDENAAAMSDYFFYGSIPFPFLLLIDKKVRHEAPKVGFMYLEAMAVTGLLYTGSDYFIDRYRPETYNTDKPASERVDGNYRNAFFAGHVALVGTATFFMAKVYNDYHPNSNFKYVMWGFAVAATGTTAYLRHKAGKHFPSDIVVGSAIGVLSGVLVPHLHRNKAIKSSGFGLSPTMIDTRPGICLSYRFR